jgi:hypothetical protein
MSFSFSTEPFFKGKELEDSREKRGFHPNSKLGFIHAAQGIWERAYELMRTSCLVDCRDVSSAYSWGKYAVFCTTV